jgi:GGDEF domain-containing protein
MVDSDLRLVSFDTDRIKDYVFATPDLKKIRGASALLEILNRADEKLLIQLGLDMETTRTTIRRFCPQIRNEEMITGGGAAMAVVPAEVASQVIAAIERLYREATVTGSITGALLPVAPSAQDFGQHVVEAGAQLRRAKDQKGYEPTLPLTAWLRSCGACGRHPAVNPSSDLEGRTELICRSCQIKEEWSDVARNLFWMDFLQQADDSWVETFPQDFGEIGRTSRPPGYLGFIYADGNGIGSLLEKMRNFPAYHHFATGLDKLVREVTYRALLEVLQRPRQDIAPFEILLMGGDDLMVVVAADAALEVALKVIEYFEAEANALAHSAEVGLPEEVHLSLSAGVVIAHDSFPIKTMHELAGDLLKSAKRKTSEVEAELKRANQSPAEQAQVPRGAIDFMVVTETATSGLEVVRTQVLADASFAVAPTGGQKFILTERPYTAPQLQKLLNHIQRFKQQNFPRKSLYAMYEALFQSKIQAQLTTLTTLVRAKQEHRELGLQFFKEFDVPLGSLPWRERSDKRFSSPLGDLVEIYPFV